MWNALGILLGTALIFAGLFAFTVPLGFGCGVVLMLMGGGLVVEVVS